MIAPLSPPAKRGGSQRTVVVREVVNQVMYILSTGCQWSALPKDLPPRSTVNDYFCRWDWDGTLGRIHHALTVQCHEQVVARAASSSSSPMTTRAFAPPPAAYSTPPSSDAGCIG